MSTTEFICPLCQAKNYCGINSPEPCWCMSKSVPPALIAKVPASEKNKSCICANCIDKFNKLTQEVT